MTETIHSEIVLREIRIDISKPARLCRATRCVFVNGKLEGLSEQTRTGVSLGNRENDDAFFFGEVDYIDIFTLFILQNV